MRMPILVTAGALVCACSNNSGPTHSTGGNAGHTQSVPSAGGGRTTASGGVAGTTANSQSSGGSASTGGAGGWSAGGIGGNAAGGSGGAASGGAASGGAGGTTSANGGTAGSTAGGAAGTSTGGTAGMSAGGATGGIQASGGTTEISTSAPNVVALTVDSGPNSIGYINGGFVSVTLCEPGTNNCQTIDHILVDTGSIGLRVLESEVTLKLAAVPGSAGKSLAECSPFVSGTSWGPVRVADVKLGGEVAKSLHIQLVGESTYTLPSGCAGTPINDLQTLGSKGIVGVGIYAEDCGSGCTKQSTNPGIYYECTGTRTGGCATAVVPLTSQIANPITAFSTDNNGSFIQLPGVAVDGLPSASGFLVFGIGTQSNNGLGGAKVIPLDNAGDATTVFPAGGTHYKSFIDSGSNGIFFLNGSLTQISVCAGTLSSFYCPQTTASLGASMLTKDGTTVPIAFTIANASKMSGNNSAFSDLGGPMPGYPTDPTIPPFDWGLPFYFGRTVFTAIELRQTPAGQGPYFAF